MSQPLCSASAGARGAPFLGDKLFDARRESRVRQRVRQRPAGRQGQAKKLAQARMQPPPCLARRGPNPGRGRGTTRGVPGWTVNEIPSTPMVPSRLSDQTFATEICVFTVLEGPFEEIIDHEPVVE